MRTYGERRKLSPTHPAIAMRNAGRVKSSVAAGREIRALAEELRAEGRYDVSDRLRDILNRWQKAL